MLGLDAAGKTSNNFHPTDFPSLRKLTSLISIFSSYTLQVEIRTICYNDSDGRVQRRNCDI